jgi:protocatechuate 3,4-dioxygenase beta subunit
LRDARSTDIERSTVPVFKRPVLTRRATLTALASAPALGMLGASARADDASAQAVAPTPSCILTPQAVEGPYYFDAKMQRTDITEKHPGVPLRLRFVVMEASSCRPIAGARVDVWHTRADGLYSGYRGQGDDHATDTTGGTFMRGTQFADAHGEVGFRTVYPGWYEGRTTHIHFKVFTDEKTVLTGQMYFPDALSQYLYANRPIPCSASANTADWRLNSGLSWSAETTAIGQAIRSRWRIGLSAACSAAVMCTKLPREESRTG